VINETAAAGFGTADRAAVYERARPTYPDAVVDLFGIAPGDRVLDLAAGTGKFTRLLVAAGADVVAVEPLASMREQLAAALPGVGVLEGTAESIPGTDASVDAVTVAQAFHWFRPAEALAEIARVLRPGGRLGLVWNERDESVPWVSELSRLMHWDRCMPYDPSTDWAALVGRSGRFGPMEQARLAHEQMLDADGLVARVLTSSYLAAAPPDEQAAVGRDVRALVAGFEAPFALPYVTDVHWCTRI
jgi:SAM-dependent methyltransferase